MSADDIIRLLESLAERLTPPARHVWDLALRQIVIEGVASAIFAGVALIGGGVVFAVALRIFAGRHEHHCDHDFLYLYGSIAVATAIAISLIFGAAAITKLLNPEWAALRMLAELVMP